MQKQAKMTGPSALSKAVVFFDSHINLQTSMLSLQL
jgi:hypothetical protein